jgi:hypothetical protein
MPIVITDQDPVRLLSVPKSRGAHQSEEFPAMLPHRRVDQATRWRDRALEIASPPPADLATP